LSEITKNGTAKNKANNKLRFFINILKYDYIYILLKPKKLMRIVDVIKESYFLQEFANNKNYIYKLIIFNYND